MSQPDRQATYDRHVTALRGLIVDWGGVLTSGIADTMAEFAAGDGIDLTIVRSVLRDWLGEPAADELAVNPIHALERGEIEVSDFEVRLAARLSGRLDRPVSAQGLVARMFARLETAHDMTGLVRRAHKAGLSTALLSNSWGNEYPRESWTDMFDVVVISGEVGMRKPEARIYRHAAELLDLPLHECVFVDDIARNIAAAVELGMVGVHHRDYATTAAELEALFGMELA